MLDYYKLAAILFIISSLCCCCCYFCKKYKNHSDERIENVIIV